MGELCKLFTTVPVPRVNLDRLTLRTVAPLGFDNWLAAIWMIANYKNGVGSKEIPRALGITQKSAWFLLHRIRLAMQTGAFQELWGTVGVDETYKEASRRTCTNAEREDNDSERFLESL